MKMNKPSTIYKPKGKAQEYSDLALNHYKGCSHGCIYCYVPKATFTTPEAFHANAVPRPGILDALNEDAPKYKGLEVFLSFACDPYCPEDVEYKLTRDVIEILHANEVGVNILTKGGLRAARDFDLLAANPGLSKIGATLTLPHDPIVKKIWEPKAADTFERLFMLKEAKAMGIETWASLEPVLNPAATLDLIRESSEFVDHYKVGRWNYDTRANKINWAEFLRDVKALLDHLGKSYYIKKDLAVFGEGLC